MSNEASAAEQLDTSEAEILSEEQVAEYLRNHPEFFLAQDDVLADLTLPHESGKAITLLERQVTIL
ncbi:MAG: DUF484 family protein, partial [OM182 bacterium]